MWMSRLGLLSLFSLPSFGGSLAPLPVDEYPRLFGVDVIHYTLSITLPDTGRMIFGETRILYEVRHAGLEELPLDLVAMRVDSIYEGQAWANFEYEGQQLRIKLRARTPVGHREEVTIWYHGMPQDGLIIRPNKFGERTIFADNWPDRARFWFPSIDHPSDKATVDFFITAPAEFQVVANGRLREVIDLPGDRRQFHWSESVRVPTYVMVLGAAKFAVVEPPSSSLTPISFWLYPQDKENGSRDFARAGEALDFFTRLFGHYPYEKLALVESSTQFGGMENASAIFFDEKGITGEGNLEGTVVHEIVHQWFGDSVTEADWHHLWLSEGLATYFTTLFYEQKEGRSRRQQMLARMKEEAIEFFRRTGTPVVDPAEKNLMRLLNPNNYQKGAWVLHMLRFVVGEEAFFKGIQDYYATFREGNAWTEDFRRIMERAGGQSLDWFFQEWIYRPGFPNLRVGWRWDGQRKAVVLEVEQRQAGSAFRMPLEVALEQRGETVRQRVWIREWKEKILLPADRKPRHVVIDPDDWLLKRVELE